MENRDILRETVNQYATIDDQIIALNEQLFTLRFERKQKEKQIVEMLKTPEFSTYNRLNVSADNSLIKVYRPTEWNRPWSLSKSMLQRLLHNYFRNAIAPNAEECYSTIVAQTTVPTDTFSIERKPATQ
jgi:hypothetical protein